MQISFALSERFRRDHFQKTGKVLLSPTNQVLPLEQMSERARAMLVEVNPKLAHLVNLMLPQQYEANLIQGRDVWESPFLPQAPEEWEHLFATYLTDLSVRKQANQQALQDDFNTRLPQMQKGDPQAFASGWKQRYKDCAGFAEAVAAHDAMVKQQEQRKAEEDRLFLEAEERKREIRDQKREERAAWIAQYGSDRLKAKSEKYDCQRQYAFERAAREHPDFAVDFGNDSRYRERSTPSDRAFDVAEQHDGKVVWLTEPVPGSYDEDQGWEPCEAVVVENYLDQYRLVYEF